MKNAGLWVLALLLAVALVGCAPDLVVKNAAVQWDGTNKKLKAKIANVGDKPAGKFLVYFDGEEDPVSKKRRPQVVKEVPHLAPATAVWLEADFAPLAHRDNRHLKNVKSVRVIVDPKNLVKEKNEANNDRSVPLV